MGTRPAVALILHLGIFLVVAESADSQCAGSDSSAAQHARVFVSESDSWELSGASGGGGGALGGEEEGGARPQTAEILKTLNQRCPDVITNNIQSRADYILVLEHEGGKGYLRHRNKVAVFTRVTGDSVVSGSTFSLGGAVEEACQAMRKDWEKNAVSIQEAEAAESARKENSPHGNLESVAESRITKLSVTSTPAAADIDLDGSFMGTTPSVVEVSAGEHTVKVTKDGYHTWARKIRAQGGNVTLAVELSAGAN